MRFYLFFKQKRFTEEKREWNVERDAYLEEQKEARTKIAELEDKMKRMTMNNIDESEYMQWNWSAILLWVCSLEHGRFKKYENELKTALSTAEMMGDDLVHVNQMDLTEWGIKIFKDKKGLMGHIQKLLDQNAAPESAQRAIADATSIAKEGARTVYISN